MKLKTLVVLFGVFALTLAAGGKKPPAAAPLTVVCNAGGVDTDTCTVTGSVTSGNNYVLQILNGCSGTIVTYNFVGPTLSFVFTLPDGVCEGNVLFSLYTASKSGAPLQLVASDTELI